MQVHQVHFESVANSVYMRVSLALFLSGAECHLDKQRDVECPRAHTEMTAVPYWWLTFPLATNALRGLKTWLLCRVSLALICLWATGFTLR